MCSQLITVCAYSFAASQCSSNGADSGRGCVLEGFAGREVSPLCVSSLPVSGCVRYRASDGIQVPFKVIPVVKELGRTRMEANVSVRSLFGAKLFALNTQVCPGSAFHTFHTIMCTLGC